MNRLGIRIGLALVVAGAPVLLAALVSNLVVLPRAASGVQSTPPQVLPPGTIISAQQVFAQVTDSRILLALGAAAALVGGYLIWRRRNQEVRATGVNPLGLFLILAALVLLLSGLTLLPKGGPGTEPVIPPNFTQWSISTRNYLNTDYGSYVFLAILAAATLGALLVAGARTTQRAASKTLQGEAQARPEPGAVLGPMSSTADFGPGPRGTILRSYKGISDSLQKRTNLDASRLTAREFETRVGAELKSARKFLGEATLLFEKAKYSDSPISREEADRAVVCLENLSPGGSEVKELPASGDER